MSASHTVGHVCLMMTGHPPTQPHHNAKDGIMAEYKLMNPERINEPTKVEIIFDGDEYRAPGPDGTEAQAYYTDDRDDAINTAHEEWKRVGKTIRTQIVCGRHPNTAPSMDNDGTQTDHTTGDRIIFTWGAFKKLARGRTVHALVKYSENDSVWSKLVKSDFMDNFRNAADDDAFDARIPADDDTMIYVG